MEEEKETSKCCAADRKIHDYPKEASCANCGLPFESGKELQESENNCIGEPFKEGFDPRRNLAGRPPDTEADKLKKKATKEIIKEYKEALGEALPLIKPVILAKALEGDMTAIKEIHDRVMDKSRQNVGLDGGEEGLAIQFASVFNKDANNK